MEIVKELNNDLIGEVLASPINFYLQNEKRFNNDFEFRNFVNNIFPYSLGIETESFLLDNNTKKIDFLKKDIENIRFETIDIGLEDSEQRFRVDNGLKGLISLELYSNFLNNFLSNTDSGNHYHIDLTDCYCKLYESLTANDNLCLEIEEYLLNELDSWNYTGNYNKRKFNLGKAGWICMRNSFKTIEVRIGELTCDYNIIIKRALHMTELVKYLKSKIDFKENLTFNSINKEKILYDMEKSLNVINKNINYKEIFKFKNEDLFNGRFVEQKKIKMYE